MYIYIYILYIIYIIQLKQPFTNGMFQVPGIDIHPFDRYIEVKILAALQGRTYTGWWFQPTWKILVKLDHFPR